MMFSRLLFIAFRRRRRGNMSHNSIKAMVSAEKPRESFEEFPAYMSRIVTCAQMYHILVIFLPPGTLLSPSRSDTDQYKAESV